MTYHNWSDRQLMTYNSASFSTVFLSHQDEDDNERLNAKEPINFYKAFHLQQELDPGEQCWDRNSETAELTQTNAELQIRGSTEDNPKIIFLISQRKHML